MKTKTFFIAAVLFFASSLCLRAQEVYEYGMITYVANLNKYELYTTLNSSTSEEKGRIAENQARFSQSCCKYYFKQIIRRGMGSL